MHGRRASMCARLEQFDEGGTARLHLDPGTAVATVSHRPPRRCHCPRQCLLRHRHLPHLHPLQQLRKQRTIACGRGGAAAPRTGTTLDKAAQASHSCPWTFCVLNKDSALASKRQGPRAGRMHAHARTHGRALVFFSFFQLILACTILTVRTPGESDLAYFAPRTDFATVARRPPQKQGVDDLLQVLRQLGHRPHIHELLQPALHMCGRQVRLRTVGLDADMLGYVAAARQVRLPACKLC